MPWSIGIGSLGHSGKLQTPVHKGSPALLRGEGRQSIVVPFPGGTRLGASLRRRGAGGTLQAATQPVDSNRTTAVRCRTNICRLRPFGVMGLAPTQPLRAARSMNPAGRISAAPMHTGNAEDFVPRGSTNLGLDALRRCAREAAATSCQCGVRSKPGSLRCTAAARRPFDTPPVSWATRGTVRGTGVVEASSSMTPAMTPTRGRRGNDGASRTPVQARAERFAPPGQCGGRRRVLDGQARKRGPDAQANKRFA